MTVLYPLGLGPKYSEPDSETYDVGNDETVIDCAAEEPNWFYNWHSGDTAFSVANPSTMQYKVKGIPGSIHRHSEISFTYLPKAGNTRVDSTGPTFPSTIGALYFPATDQTFWSITYTSGTRVRVNSANLTSGGDDQSSDKECSHMVSGEDTDYNNDYDADRKVTVVGDASGIGSFRIATRYDTYNAQEDVECHDFDSTLKLGRSKAASAVEKLWVWFQFVFMNNPSWAGVTLDGLKLELDVASTSNIESWLDYSGLGAAATGTADVKGGETDVIDFTTETPDLSGVIGVTINKGTGTASWSAPFSDTMTGASNANPMVVTHAVGPLDDVEVGDLVSFDGVVGMTELNDLAAQAAVTARTTTSFTIGSVDSTTFGTFVSGEYTAKKVVASISGSPDLSGIAVISAKADRTFVRFDTATGGRYPEWFPIKGVDNTAKTITIDQGFSNSGSSKDWLCWERDCHLMWLKDATGGDVPGLGDEYFQVKSVDDGTDEVTLNSAPGGTLSGEWNIGEPICEIGMAHLEADVEFHSMNASGGAFTPPHDLANAWTTNSGDAQFFDKYVEGAWGASVFFRMTPISGSTAIIVESSNTYIHGSDATTQEEDFLAMLQRGLDDETQVSLGMCIHALIDAWDDDVTETYYGPVSSASYIEYTSAQQNDTTKRPKLTLTAIEPLDVILAHQRKRKAVWRR